MTHSRRTILETLDRFETRPSRALGQNFVTDPNTVRRIARLAELDDKSHVVEVGAGLGSLTLALIETGARVTAIEVDRKLIPALGEILGEQAKLVEADAMKVDWNSIVPPSESAVLVANLPYNVGTSIVMRVLDEAPQFTKLVVMVQKEVAERMAAKPGSGAYGAMSVKVRYHADARLLGTVPPTVFVPKPEVDSALVEIVRLPEPRVSTSIVSAERLFIVVRAGFAQRRKMLRKSLSGVVTPEAFERAGVAPTMRAEELDVEQWGRLAS